jgi:hypothetical protein
MGPSFMDLTGHIFGYYIVLRLSNRRTKHGALYWWCECCCGTVKEVIASSLRSGATVSCGCYAKERITKANYKHGMAVRGSVSPEHSAYTAARSRVTDPSNKDYANYGGRGVKFLFTSFEQFYIELGPRPSSKHSVNRIDNEGNYEPGNIEWATAKEQAANRRPLSDDHKRKISEGMLSFYTKR